MQKHTTIKLNLRQELHIGDKTIELDNIIKLLTGLKQQPNLRYTAAKIGYSYRKAWNLLKNIEQHLELNLLLMERGRGTQLTQSGVKLLGILQDNQRLLSHPLSQRSEVATTLLQPLLASPPSMKIIASDHEGLCRLREKMLFSLEIAGSLNALKAYAQGECTIAGFHLPIGALGRIVLSRYQNYLDNDSYQFLLIDQREQGIISSPFHPVASLEQIVTEGLRFVNRQQNSGTRTLLDVLLTKKGLIAQQLKGYTHEEHTHLAVASVIAAREADAGLGIKSVAQRLNLHFMPMTKECYFLLLSVKSLNLFEVKTLLALLFPQKKYTAITYSQLKQLAIFQ